MSAAPPPGPTEGAINVQPLAVLMAVRIKGRAAPAAVAAAAGLREDDTDAALAAASARGLLQPAAPRPGDVPSGAAAVLTLTPDGQRELAALLAAEPRDRVALAQAYEAFLAVDADLKTAITAWQLAAGAARGGRGAALAAAGACAAAAAERLAALVARYAPYRRRLAAAVAALRAGDERYAASPRVDSLHQVWFELHEDLLLTLGRERRS
ncbi:MAG TPA: hypothetical protein VGK30_15685 [Candidatus Binatia bacterium]